MKKQGLKGIILSGIISAGITAGILTSPAPAPPAQPTVVTYPGDTWEKQNAINYNNTYLSAIKPTGDLRADFGAFLFGQGGGKSKDQKDQITAFPNAWPPCTYVDGYKYHTVHDITWYLFSNKEMAAWVGYVPTCELFYAMPDSIRNGIIDYHINKGKITTSPVVNITLAYMVWGGGGYAETVRRFESVYGRLQDNINASGDYFAFSQLLIIRQQVMKDRNPQSWPVYGRGWSSGLAHFHRVFKVYTTQK